MSDALSLNLTDADPVTLDVVEADGISLSITEEIIELSVDGIVGPVGPPGGNYRHVQAAPSTAWTVGHDLGFRPSVTVEDSAGTVVEGDVVHVDANNLTISFDAPFGGYANLS